MSGVGQAVFMNQRSFGPPPPGAIGSAYEGGFYAGDISTTANGVATHRLVVAPKSSGQFVGFWKTSRTLTTGTTSVIDGPANTAAMIAAGAAAHPCANFCNNLTVGSFTDWYMPAINELEISYFNLKPTTELNDTYTPSSALRSQANTNAVPSRSSQYTSGNPAQTLSTAFQDGNTETYSGTAPDAAAADRYWSSTQTTTAKYAMQIFFFGFVPGRQTLQGDKQNNYRVRAIRRVPV